MPKSKKPAGGRPAKNFDPRFGPKKSGAKKAGTTAGGPQSGPKAGSRSPKHRGYRAESEEQPLKKNRWNADERAARQGERSSAERPIRGERVDRGDRTERGARTDRYDRPARSDRFDRSDRPARAERSDRGDRPERGSRFDRSDRFDRPQRADRGDRFDRSDRGDRPERGRRPERDDSRFRRDDRDDRGARRGPSRDGVRDSRDDRRPLREDGRRGFDRHGDRSNDRFAERPHRMLGSRAGQPHIAPRHRKETEIKPRFTPEEDVVLERLEAQAINATDVAGLTFDQLGLGKNISQSLKEMGVLNPFPIQAATIPDALAGRDVLGRGKTGSGKTVAFGAPLVERLLENEGAKSRKHGRAARALILAPTRELAMQIDRTVQPIARSVGLFTTTIVGGVPQGKQLLSLRKGVDIIIATPGRLEDLAERGHIDLSQITITVLDEADHMCDLGFLEPVQRILRDTAENGQRLLFSATLDKGVAKIVDEFLQNPAVHEVAGEDQASSTIEHLVFVVDHRSKVPVIEDLCQYPGKILIFTRTRAYAEQLADMLEDANIPAVSLHGDLNQSRRTRNLQLLTSGRVDVLVATDVAARGIHVDDIDLVIQADPPDEYKTYMHRAGRTGRAGKQGTVVTLVAKTRQRKMNDLLQRAEIQAAMIPVEAGSDVLGYLPAK